MESKKQSRKKHKTSINKAEDLLLVPTIDKKSVGKLAFKENKNALEKKDGLSDEDEVPDDFLDQNVLSHKGLAPFDPLRAYIQEIAQHPLLSREEEQELTQRFVLTREPKVFRRLVTSNLRLVVKIAYEYRQAHRQILDLIQEGNIGLMQAIQKYDASRGVRLSSYSAWWIRAYILKFILNNFRLVKVGTTQAQRKLFFNLNKEKERLEASGFTPTAQLLSKTLAVSEEEVNEMQLRLGAKEVSLDSPIKNDDSDGRTQMDLISTDEKQRPDITAEAEEFRAILNRHLKQFESTLSGREQMLFRERLLADDPLTLQQLGDKYGISRERARQIESKLLTQLKEYLKKELGDSVQIAMGLQ